MDVEITHARFLTAMCSYADWTGQKCRLSFQEHIPRAIQKMNHASFPTTTAAFSTSKQKVVIQHLHLPSKTAWGFLQIITE